jgi:hypothetical protein
MNIDESDARKIFDALDLNERYHVRRDEMNGAIHRAPHVRFSPITTETISARERLEKLFEDAGLSL